MKYFVVVEDYSGAVIYSEGTYNECLSTLHDIYDEMIAFRAVMPKDEWRPVLYNQGADTLIVGGDRPETYTIYGGIDADEVLRTLYDWKEYHS